MKKLFSVLLLMGMVSCSVSPKDEVRIAQTLANKHFSYDSGVKDKYDRPIYDNVYFDNDYRKFNIESKHYYTLESQRSTKVSIYQIDVDLFYTNNNPNIITSDKRKVIKISEYDTDRYSIFYRIGDEMMLDK